jgi:hypothetical protein
LLSEKEIDYLKRNSKISKQLTINDYLNDGVKEEEFNDKNYEKELLKSLIENEKDKINFQNTKNNVSISNTHRASSKMCLIM